MASGIRQPVGPSRLRRDGPWREARNAPGAPLPESAAPAQTSLLDDSLYYRLFDEAERARWRMADIPFGALERQHVTPALVALVREVAASELTTFSASRRFLQDFADDADFSQWVAVWLYEETKHPQALMRWLAEVGEVFDGDFMRRGRVTVPFMKSRTGTLVMNVISELFASARYLSFSRRAREPVLATIARHLAGDEGRHATSFLAYARRAVERAEQPDRERLEAVKVLYYWLFEGDKVQHPIGLMEQRAAARTDLAETLAGLPLDLPSLRARACRAVGRLADLPALHGPDDVLPELRRLSALHRAREEP
jgi:hypothetical protein